MPQEQYDKWFLEEQRQVTKEKKQKLLQSTRQQQQTQSKCGNYLDRLDSIYFMPLKFAEFQPMFIYEGQSEMIRWNRFYK